MVVSHLCPYLNSILTVREKKFCSNAELKSDLILVKSMIHLSDQKETFKSEFSMALPLYTVTVDIRSRLEILKLGYCFACGESLNLSERLFRVVYVKQLSSAMERDLFQSSLASRDAPVCFSVKKVYRP